MGGIFKLLLLGRASGYGLYRSRKCNSWPASVHTHQKYQKCNRRGIQSHVREAPRSYWMFLWQARDNFWCPSWGLSVVTYAFRWWLYNRMLLHQWETEYIRAQPRGSLDIQRLSNAKNKKRRGKTKERSRAQPSILNEKMRETGGRTRMNFFFMASPIKPPLLFWNNHHNTILSHTFKTNLYLILSKSNQLCFVMLAKGHWIWFNIEIARDRFFRA